jgi:glycosyltransferase involved in cell wall biosynthesis
VRVVCLSHYFPLPANSGGRMRVHGLLRALAREHDVHLIALREPGMAAEPEASVATRLGISVEALPTPRAPRPAALWGRSVVNRTPPWVTAPRSHAFAQRATAAAKDADVVVALDDYVTVHAAALKRAARVPIVADKHVVLAAMGADEPPPRRLRDRLAARLVRSYEARYLRHVDAAVVTSEEEAERFRRLYGRSPEAVVPSAVDLPPHAAPNGSPHSVAWIGSFDGRPIVDGLLRFAESAWEPLGRQGFELLVGGRGPLPAVRELERLPGVRLVGYVEDLDAFLGSAGAAVVPLWGGHGVKLKTLTLLGAGLPVAATPTALEGIPAADGRDCIVGADPEELADGLRRLAQDRQLAHRIAHGARRLVSESFSWEQVGPRFVEVVERVAR